MNIKRIISFIGIVLSFSIICMEPESPVSHPSIQTLFEAIKEDNPERVKTICATHPHLINIRSRDTQLPDTELPGYTMMPLHLATCLGHNACMQTLLELGADPNALDSQFASPLHFAYSPKGTMLLLAKGALPNHRNRSEVSPLFCALLNEFRSSYTRSYLPGLPNPKEPFYKVASVLLRYGADINDSCKTLSLLHHAVHNKNIKLVNFLLENGADPEKDDGKGNTPFGSLLEKNDSLSRKLLEVFEKYGMLFFPNSKDVYDNPLVFLHNYQDWELFIAKEQDPSFSRETFIKGLHNTARLLRIADAHGNFWKKKDPSHGVQYNMSGCLIKKIPLRLLCHLIGKDTVTAARSHISGKYAKAFTFGKNDPCAKTLLTLHLQEYPFVKEGPGASSLLEETIEKKFHEYLTVLLPSPDIVSIDINVPYTDQKTAYTGTFLHKAVQCLNIPAIIVLLKNGIDYLRCDCNDKTPLDLAKDLKHNDDMIKAFNIQIIHDILASAREGNYKKFKKLLKIVPNINKPVDSHDGMTLLHKFALRYPIKWIVALLNAKADIHARDRDGDTPLCSIVYSDKRSKDRIELLVSHGALLENVIKNWRYELLSKDIKAFLQELYIQQNQTKENEKTLPAGKAFFLHHTC